MTTRGRIRPGRSAPLGAVATTGGVNFALRSAPSTKAWLMILDPETAEVRMELALDPARHRTGAVWHLEVDDLEPPVAYAWRLDGPSGDPHRFDPRRALLDPYGRAVGGAERWGRGPEPAGAGSVSRHSTFLGSSPRRRSVSRPQVRAEERVVYELSVRGFTRHPASGVADSGTFAGLAEKIPHLQSLGVTTVELLPVAEWDEHEVTFRSPGGEPLRNLWGYSPLAFSAPKAGLAVCPEVGGAVAELRSAVEALHAAGLEVFLDVVFNHTGERRLRAEDPAFAFQGIDRESFYRLDASTGRPIDVTGCGNSVRTSHGAVGDLILDALRWWHLEIGFDGFRFDLAAALARGEDGILDPDGALLRRIATDPELEGATLVAEPWDSGGLYLPGRFPSWGRWAEWNDGFRQAARRFFSGEPGQTRALAAALAGSPERFAEAGSPLASVNYVTSHDGFTLADLVAYEQKRNEANGEGNRDGASHSHNWNCGAEGPSDDEVVVALRRRQQRNLLTLLFVARGIPMLLAGDEIGNSQGGNNNAYCQDNEMGWVDWALPDEGLLRFVRLLVAFRRAHPGLRRDAFLPLENLAGAPPTWHGTHLGAPDWGDSSRTLALHLHGDHADAPDDDFLLVANGSDRELPLGAPIVAGIVLASGARYERSSADGHLRAGARAGGVGVLGGSGSEGVRLVLRPAPRRLVGRSARKPARQGRRRPVD